MKQLLFAFILLPVISTAQHLNAHGGGSYTPVSTECISPAQRIRFQEIANANIKQLKEQGKHATSTGKSTAVLFDWPLQQASGFNYHSIYGISGFRDNNPSFPNLLLDYNCGARTYDLASGYNHGGVDIFLWPFSINMMQAQQAHVVAAAAGTIVAKHDGEFDLNCAMSNADANYIFLQHSDGTRTWYLHMKTNSLTTKNVGDAVVAGEFLGLVGSSGSSTGPHLHFEVHNQADIVIDPYSGPCNTSPSLWNNQLPYKDPQINTLMTHSAAPVLQNCPTPDNINARDTFTPGSTVYLAAYYHDQTGGEISSFSILRPDNSVYNTWSHDGGSGGYYTASFWFWSYTIPASQPLGKWKFRAVYQGSTYEHDFHILFPSDVATATIPTAGVYPNPANNVLYLSNMKADNVTISDPLGKIVLFKNNVQNGQMDISTLANGMYYVRIIEGNTISTLKISVQK